MKIRAVVKDDLNELQTLVVETIKSTCKNDYSQEQIDAWISSAKKNEHWEKVLDSQFSLVAEIDNKAAGLGTLENGKLIYFMYVHKDYLGLGIASALFKALEKESQRLGHKQISANVSKTALPFFEKKGFKAVKENSNIINDVTIINYHCVKNT